jgi:DNA-binding response OmpR family regulator
VEHKDARILVIDDEPLMADSLRQNLVEEGYAVDTAATGAEAIELDKQQFYRTRDLHWRRH